ncbi:MAG: LysM peptidoglycan-binding domain-containing protein, partial [Algicola sp.]|nr:LysM peptidoglycan-binding domain-containing protein [Algicola sp.]
YDAWDIADYPSTVPFEPPVLEKEIQKEPAVRSAPELYPPPQGEPKPDQPVVLNGNKQAKSPNTSNIAVKKLMVISGFCLVFLFSIIANVLYYGPSESEGSFAHDVKNLSEQFDLIAADSTIDNKAFKLFIEQYELSPVMVQGQWKSNVYLERMKHQNSTELGHQIKNNKIKQMLDKLEDFEFDQVDRDKLSVDSQLKLKIHQVEMDETLSSISRKYDIALGKLLAQNPGNGDKIFPGQKLVIPNDKNSASQIVDVIELKRTFNVVNRDKELGLDNLKAFYLVWVRLNASTKLGIFNYTGFLTLNSRLQGELTAINQGVKVRSNIERAWVKLIANKFAKVKRKMRHLSL